MDTSLYIMNPSINSWDYDYSKELEGCHLRSGYYSPDGDVGVTCHITNVMRSLKNGAVKLTTYVGIYDHDYYLIDRYEPDAYLFIPPEQEGDELVEHQPTVDGKVILTKSFRSMASTGGHVGLNREMAYIYWTYDKPTKWDAGDVRSMITGAIVKLGISLRECKTYAIAEYEAKKQKEIEMLERKEKEYQDKKSRLEGQQLTDAKHDWKHDESLII